VQTLPGINIPFTDLGPKQLGLLHDLLPQATRFGMLVEGAGLFVGENVKVVQEAGFGPLRSVWNVRASVAIGGKQTSIALSVLALSVLSSITSALVTDAECVHPDV
jgi:hypothetical protein